MNVEAFHPIEKIDVNKDITRNDDNGFEIKGQNLLLVPCKFSE
jgi:hypothetical protein